jgi:hypothetical protein
VEDFEGTGLEDGVEGVTALRLNENLDLGARWRERDSSRALSCCIAVTRPSMFGEN